MTLRKSRWAEPLNDQHETLIIRKVDGGLVEDDVRQQYGDLHSDEGSFTVNKKIPVYKPTRLGRPRLQDRMLYFLSAEEHDPYDDEDWVHRKLPEAYGNALAEAREKNKNKTSNGAITGGGVMSVIWMLLAFTLFLTIWMGGSVAGQSSNSPVTDSGVAEPPPTVQVDELRPTPEVTVDGE